MSVPTLTYDAEVRAMYVRFTDHAVSKSIELSETVYVDLDDNGEPVGFEILEAQSSLLEKLTASHENHTLKELLNIAS
jgi:uncharacterized protein YuzE